MTGLTGSEGSGTLPTVPKDDLKLSDSVWVQSLKVDKHKKQLKQGEICFDSVWGAHHDKENMAFGTYGICRELNAGVPSSTF